MLYLRVLAMIGLCSGPLSAATALLNEFQPNPPGSDPAMQSIEIFGTPGESFTGTLISVETDDIATFGEVQDLDTISGVFDVNGFFVASIDDLENPSYLLALVGLDFTLSSGDSIDANDDGIIDDLSVFGTVFDAISIADEVGDEVTFASQLGGTDFSFVGEGAFNDEPELIFRDSTSLELFAVNSLATDSVVFNSAGEQIPFSDFDLVPNITTFGAQNPTVVPSPSSTALLFVALFPYLMMRRRSA